MDTVLCMKRNAKPHGDEAAGLPLLPKLPH
jgi:hypothetical protein